MRLKYALFSISARRFLCAALVFSSGSCATSAVPDSIGFADFATRCAAPGVIRCFGFERSELATQDGPIHWSHSDKSVGVFVNGRPPSANLKRRVELASDQFASGASSLKFYMPSNSGAGHAGQFYANFSDDLATQFGEGDEFYVQWRQRFSPEFLTNRYTPYNSWKQAIVGEGSRPGFTARSCSQLELVVSNKNGSPAMYHSCRGKDGDSEGLPRQRAADYVPNEWMTFQLRVSIGTWYQNDRRYNKDSLIELWVAREGQASIRVLSHRYDLANTRDEAKYGTVWLLPYLTSKDREQRHADAYTWYDELIVSRNRIADPAP